MKNSSSCLGKLFQFRSMFFRKELLAFLTIGLLLFSNGLPMMAQSRNEGKYKVTGKVTNESSSPVSGVTIQEAGTKNGVTTDNNGAFTIYVQKADAKLQVSYIGYASQSVPVNGNQALAIVLEPAASLLNDIVVVGYGKQKKGEVTGAVANVKKEDFTQGFAKDAGQLIQGKVAGLAVVSTSGDPNATTQISLRGNSTIMSSTQPLILIDGIPGELNTVAPEDIESIDVLKDGSAAAIYGTRGTNGVILVTTRKRNTALPATLSYDGYMSVQTIARKMNFMNATDVRRLVKEGFYDPSYDLGTSTDWLSEISRTPVSHTHNLTLQGGTGQTNYIASLNYREWQGLFKRSDNQQYTGRLDVNHSMFDNKLKFNIGMINRNKKYFDGPDYAYIYRQAIIRNPTDSVYDYLGKWKEDPNGYFYDNPVRPIEETEGQYKFNELRLNGSVTFSPVRDFNIKLMLSSVKVNGLGGYAESFNHRSSESLNRNGYAARSSQLQQDKLLEFTTDYTKSFNQHKFTVLGGYSYQNVDDEGFNAFNADFPTALYTYNNLSSGNALYERGSKFNVNNYGMGSYKTNYKLIGFFGRINYSLSDKYLLMASLRHEGSSKFGQNYKWGQFPAVSLGWRINKESFMQSVKFVNDLKLRAGFGVTGTVPTDPYQSLISLTYFSNNRFLYNGNWIQPIGPSRNPNPDLRWEKKEEYNIGLDFALFNRLSGSLDLYQRDTKDMLYDFPVPVPPNFVGSTLANAGSMRNRGLELLLNYDIVRSKNVDFKVNATYSTNSNKLLSISNKIYQTTNNYFDAGYTGEPIQENTHRVQVGEPIGNFYGYKTIDIDQEGKWIIDGEDGKPKPLAESTPSDKKILGNGIPKQVAGLNLYFRYKKADIAVNMRGAFSYQIVNFQRMYYENPKIKQYNLLKSAFDNVYGKTRLDNDLAFVSYYVENGDHWKVDNVTLGYNFDVTNNKYFKRARVYASALNLLVLTKYKGIDPEVNRLGLDPGLDPRDKYPTTRTFTFGINLGF